ncbi:MAG: hypothetical protein QNJ38_00280 [Prochloraceae cyanobacterium]|nr:hypothetical protein [Prochloraceae cyanobacterium]
MKNFQNWPAWIPNPNALMSTLLLILMIEGLKLFLTYIFPLDGLLIVLPPKLKTILYLGTILSPIVVIAAVHHWLHLILDRFFPDMVTPEMGKTQGIIPGLISWWEGLYGWLAIYLSGFIIVLVNIILNPLAYHAEYFLMSDLLNWWNIIIGWFTLPNLVRVVTIAYLYQFDSVYKNHLMSLAKAAIETKASESDLDRE